MSKDELRLLDFWASPFCMRVKIGLAEKDVAYESQEEGLFGGKSDLLLKSNPIYEKVPVLLDNGKAIVESNNIVYYIDDKYPSPNTLLPSSGMGIWKSKGEELEIAKKDFIKILKKLEGAMGDKDYFGGDNFGYVDVIAIAMTSWFHAYDVFGGFKVEEECPKFGCWIKRCLKRESVSSVLPDPEKVYQCVVMLRKMHGIE
ncbi:hypothetical protein K7X08_017655 [Anisodus acutangulus]|uniref:glutathione transferase n=1 Tax=Anisodus acutangulus TaxID=402998 RepID=A0A9Q1R8S3_9SOLA|nr:hypothetical protein K7X08_017655 [Anisodus acutangulus]